MIRFLPEMDQWGGLLGLSSFRGLKLSTGASILIWGGAGGVVNQVPGLYMGWSQPAPPPDGIHGSPPTVGWVGWGS